jgi:hypothetical protein
LARHSHIDIKVIDPSDQKEEVMNKTQIQQKIARLEFIHDQLETELVYVDELLKSVGFPRGLESAKEVAEELLEQNQEKPNENQ